MEGHVGAFDWLGGVVRECVYDNLRSASPAVTATS
jgi:transposase